MIPGSLVFADRRSVRERLPGLSLQTDAVNLFQIKSVHYAILNRTAPQNANKQRACALDSRVPPVTPTPGIRYPSQQTQDCLRIVIGINCPVDLNWLGIRNAVSVPTINPTNAIRRKNRRSSQSRRTLASNLSRERWSSISSMRGSIASGWSSVICSELELTGPTCRSALYGQYVSHAHHRTFHSIPSVIDFRLFFPRLRPESQLQGGRYVGMCSGRDDRK